MLYKLARPIKNFVVGAAATKNNAKEEGAGKSQPILF